MIHYVLLILTMSPRTGEIFSSETSGQPFSSAAECIRVAVDKGPQKASEGRIKIYSCEEEREDVV